MSFKEALLDTAVPITMFEVVPPAAAKPEAVEASLQELRQLRGRVDAINIPEIHDEDRPGERTSKFIERVEPRLLGSRIKHELGIDVVINRVTVHDAEPERWFRETCRQWDVTNWVLVGGESKAISYPGRPESRRGRPIGEVSESARLTWWNHHPESRERAGTHSQEARPRSGFLHLASHV
jgi:hypothetical protein